MMTVEEKRTVKYLRDEIARLRKDGNELFNKILTRDTRGLFTYPKNKLETSWRLDDLYQRTVAAQSLGFNVILNADDDGLHFHYAKKLPTSRPGSF